MKRILAITLSLSLLMALPVDAAMWLRQGTAVTVKLGPFVDSTDGVTPEESLTISQADIRLSKNGGNIAQSNNAAGATPDELGYYDIPLNTIDTATLGALKVIVSEAGALPVWQEFMVVPANVYDSMFGNQKLQVDVTHIQGGILAGGTNPGVVATNFNTFFNNVDAGSSVKVDDIEAILVDTGTAGVVVNSASAQTIVDLWFDELVADHDDVAGSWGALLADVFTETVWDAFITGAPEYVEPPTSGENATAVWTEPVRTLTGTE